MIKAENLDNQRKKQNLLSLLLTSVKQSFQFRKQSSIWFTPILSFSFPNQQLRIKNDLEKQEYEQLLKLLNLLVSDIFLFYKKQINSMLYHLLTVIKTVFGLGDPEEFQQPGLTAFSGFYQFMNQIHLSNTLALLMLKHKQYSIAFQYFDFIINVIEQEKIDIYEDIFLSTVSNYLCLLQMHPINKFPHKTKQLVQMLQNIYQGLLNKFLRKGYQQNNLLTLVSIFKQNQTHLGHRFQLQTKLLLKKFQQTKEGNDKKTEYIQHFLSLNKPFKVGRIDSKPMEMKFLAPSLFNNQRERIHRSTDLSDKAKGDLTARNFQTVEHLLRRTGRLGDQFINTNTIDFETIKKNRYKRTLQKQMATIEKQKLITIVKLSPEKRQIQKIENKQQKKEQKKQEKKEEKQEEKKKAASPQKETKKDEIIKRQRVYLKNQVLYFRINYSKMEINNEGIILLDFVQERKKFITWYEVYQILQNVRFSFLFSDFLPICCYYDVARILSYYVYRAHSDDCWGAAILDIPKQIAEIDMLTKFYKDEGPYLKALFLSKYDVTHVQYSINCYLADIEEYFKCANSNEYIDKLNKRILKQKYENEQKYLSLQQWKKKKDQTIQRINNFQFVKIIQDDIAYLRSSLFKIILLLPRKKQILLFIHEKDIKQTEEKGPLIVPISIINIEDVNKKQNRLNIPIYKISRYFPLEPFNLINWVKSYGKFIIEGYISCFFNYPQSFNNMQYFNVITYAKKIQMTNQGKYKTPVIAELIGTKTRIWGISIRYYEQFNTREVSTFILNPYYELLAPVIKLNPSERKKILIDQLLSGSVSATYTKLLQKGFVGKTINIINYWNLIEY